MNTFEHTFPLPEVETHKLDEMKQELREQPLAQRTADFFGGNVWAQLAVAAMAGILVGAWWKTRA